jgi:tetratricopeptide (TPR) repeat protein
MKISATVAFIIALALPVSGCVAAQEPESQERATECKQRWARVPGAESSGYGVTRQQMLAEWKKQEQYCRGTGVYEVQLALLLLDLGRSHDAAEALEAAQPADPNFRARAEALKLRIAFLLEIERGEPSPALIAEYASKFEELSSRGGSCSAHEYATNFFAWASQPGKAIEFAKKQIECDPDGWNGYAMLTLLSDRTGDFASARTYCIEARRRFTSLSKSVPFMLSCAKGFAYAKDAKTVDAIFTILDLESPEAKNRPDYKEAREFSRRELSSPGEVR